MATMGWIPTVPDTPEQTEEFLPVVILNGREHTPCEQIDIYRTYESAAELAQLYAHHVRNGATWAVLRRQVGHWEVA